MAGLIAAEAAHGAGEGAAPLEAYQFLWPIDGEHAQQHLVKEREHRGVGADAESQRDDYSQREGRRFAQLAERVANVVEQRIHFSSTS